MSKNHYPAFEDLRNHFDALAIINEKLQAHAAGMAFVENPAELSQRELVGLTTATAAVLTYLSNLVEQMEEQP